MAVHTGPPALPLLGHAVPFLRDKLGFLTRCARDHGDVVELELRGRTLLLTHPDDIRHVLVTCADRYTKIARISGTRAGAIVGRNVITTEGAEHLRLRRALQPRLRRASEAAKTDRAAAMIEEVVSHWRSRGRVDVAAEIPHLVLRWMIVTLLGDKVLECFPGLPQALELQQRYADEFFTALRPLPHLWPTRLNRAYRRARSRLTAALDEAMKAAAGGDSAPGPLLDTERDGVGDGISSTQLRDQCIALVAASQQTTARLATWALFLLARHGEQQERLASAVRHACGDRRPSGEMLAEVPYLRQVLAEALRLYPPTWLFLRQARENDILPSCSAPVTVGTTIYLSQWVTHRDPRFFPEPERFDPERFTDAATRTRPAFAYFPFGGGRRACLGEEMALMASGLIVAASLLHSRLLLVPGHNVRPLPRVTLEPSGPVWLELS